MYTKFYGLSDKPFNISPDPNYLYRSPNHKKALAHLEYGLLGQVGLTLVTGDVGTGKTTIIRYIVEHYRNDLLVGVIFNTNVSPAEFFSLILSAFNLESAGGRKNEQLDQFKQFLNKQRAEKRKISIIIDEAQGLSDETLEEVRLLSNIQIDYPDVMQIILIGQPELLERILTPRWVSLGQRIGVNFHLESLDEQQSCQYIAHRIEQAGGTQSIFSEAALKLIYKHSNGIPRLINLICDAALVYGYGDDLSAVDAPIIEVVVKERAGIGLKKELGALESRASNKQNNNGHVEHRLQNLEDELREIKNQLEWQQDAISQLIPRSKEDLISKAKIIIAKERRSRKILELQVKQLKQLLSRKSKGNNTYPAGASKASPRQQKSIVNRRKTVSRKSMTGIKGTA